MSARLQQALEALYGLERHKDKLGLEGTLSLLAALGDPQASFRSIHVAGTNGKGSVCALIERVMREAGYRTGLFTSPHLVDFRERVRVKGRWADARWLERRLDHIQSLPEGRHRTFFEVCTALAFDYFATRRVEIAVVEVGLGGRLDCTNVLAPMVTVITSIGLDHTEILGPTIEKIAAEKAGILKPGVPVVTHVTDRRAMRVIEWHAAKQQARVEPVGRVWWHSTRLKGGRRVRRSALEAAPWAGRMELRSPEGCLPENVATAVETLAVLRRQGLKISKAALKRGIEKTRWPGRFTPCPGRPRLWWDGAHNPDGISRLVEQWNAVHGSPPAAIVLALSRDKDAAAILEVLRGGFGGARLLVTRTRSERAQAVAELRGLAAVSGFTVEAAADVPAAVERALEIAGEGRVLLTGSLFAVGEAMEAFGGAPGERL